MNKDFNTSKELDTILAKIKAATKQQELMKACNKIIKTHKADPAKCIPQLVALGAAEHTAAKLLQKDFAGRIGFASYLLTNNNADIKRWQAKADLLQKKVQAESSAGGNLEFAFTGGTCVYNFGYDRLQLLFDEIPAEDLRKRMKDHGFVFSPTETAWQRPLTENAVWHAGQVTDGVGVLPTLAALAGALAPATTIDETLKLVFTNPDAQEKLIITEHITPPIPTTAYDWKAYYAEHADEEKCVYGYGSTKQQAIDNLIEKTEE